MGQVINLSHFEAWHIAEIAFQSLLKDQKCANICIVNRQGQSVIQITMDGTKPCTAHVALLKARQSASTGRRTRFVRDMVVAENWTLGVLNLNPDEYVAVAGGVPIYDDSNILLGAIGISNLDEDKDEVYSINSVEKAGFGSAIPS